MRPGQRMKDNIDVFEKKRIRTSLNYYKSCARNVEKGNKFWVPIMEPCVEYCMWHPKFLGEFCVVLQKKKKNLCCRSGYVYAQFRYVKLETKKIDAHIFISWSFCALAMFYFRRSSLYSLNTIQKKKKRTRRETLTNM